MKKNPLGYDKGQITLFGFSHNSLSYEIHVKILCNSKREKVQLWAPLSHLPCNPAEEELYQLLGTRASHTLTDCPFFIPRGQNHICRAQGVRHTQTDTGDRLRSTSITQNTCGTALGKHRHPQVT